jgi:hypothetical protein
MTLNVLNPDSVILGQLEGQWQKLFVMLVWKLAREKGVTLTHKDMAAYQRDFEAGRAHFLTHGHFDSIEFKIVTAAEAQRLAAYDATQRGNA